MAGRDNQTRDWRETRADDLRSRFPAITAGFIRWRPQRLRIAWEGLLAVVAVIVLSGVIVATRWPYIRALGDWAFGPTTPRYFASCDMARAANWAPIYRGMPGYREALDGDRDGIACEPLHNGGHAAQTIRWFP